MEPARLILLSLVERHGTLLRTAIRRLGTAYRLQPVHVQALMYLQQANRYSNTTQALTEFLGLTKGTVSQSVMLLSRKRLIERYMDERDKRIVRLSLSAKGERLLLELQLALDWQAATRDISSTRLKSATRVLRDTLHALQMVNGGRSFGNCHNCEYYWKEGLRIYRCGFTGERLSSAETYKICRLHSPV